MRISGFVQGFAAVCLAASASTVSAQNAYQLFSPADVRYSNTSATYLHPDEFNMTALDLTCPSSAIVAKISSTADGNGYVLVDDFISFSTGGPAVNICTGGITDAAPEGPQQNCFSETYRSAAPSNGTDPDSLLPGEGVPPLDVSGLLTGGSETATIGLKDTGGHLAGSTLYLVTNCTSHGVAGSGKVTGNPISSTPTAAELNQDFTFNPTKNQVVQFGYDLSEAENNNSLSIADGTIPNTADKGLDPNTFSTKYLSGTSFATANCLLHTGELVNGNAACKLYTLTCQQGTSSTKSGALCPTSQERDEIFQEAFDGPPFSLLDHQGVGLLEASDGWTGLSCAFDSASGLGDLLCPQNLLTNFYGAGLYTSGGRGQNPNSTFISVAPVLEDLTTYKLPGLKPGNWINTLRPTVDFVITPPAATINNFVAAPILNLTYGISSPSDVPQPGPPVPGDTTVTNPTSCPAPGSQNSEPATVFTPPAQTLDFPGDGKYVVHYLAQDCAGTEELKFTNSGGIWSTSFYSFPINVDTVFPLVATGPTLSPAPTTIDGVANAYLVGTPVMANYSCTDVGSGVVKCGDSTYWPGKLSTGPLTSKVDTSQLGPQTFTVKAVDAAGNTTTKSVRFTVVAPPANLRIVKRAPPCVKHGEKMDYRIKVHDFGKQAATAVVITDHLPAGVSFLKAEVICSSGKCYHAPGSCSFLSGTVSCTVPSVTHETPILVHILVKVTASPGTTIKNTAKVSSANPEGPNGIPEWCATTKVQ